MTMPTTSSNTMSYHPENLAEGARLRETSLLKLLQALVELESPSDQKASVDRCLDFTAEVAAVLGARIRRHRRRDAGNVLEARFGPQNPGRRAGTPLLLLGHLDTVWPLGTLAAMPFRIEKGRAWGPGVFDMKAGVAIAITALDLLQAEKLLTRPVTLLLVGDEETGSHASRAITEKVASRCESVYVLEPAQGLEGAYKTARKGVAAYRIHVTGVAAHSGVDFERGHSAIAELARQVGVIAAWSDLKRGITINIGTIQGGTRSNVVAAEAWAEVDVRVARIADFARIDRRFRSLRVQDKGCVLKVEGELNRPPMERTRGTVALYRRAATLAAAMGFRLQEASTGGGSDGNFTSALGIPTLDGMGAVGEGAHARNESVVVRELAPRTALLAAMICGP
ncbi:MAG: M20 family metallopeptidase [Silvibacterium sp.]